MRPFSHPIILTAAVLILGSSMNGMAGLKMNWSIGGPSYRTGKNCPSSVRHSSSSCRGREHHTCGRYRRIPYTYYRVGPYDSYRTYSYTPGNRSSIVYSVKEKERDRGPFEIEWANEEETVLLIPPKRIEKGAVYELPDKKEAIVIEWTNSEITLLVDKRLVTYPFLLKN